MTTQKEGKALHDENEHSVRNRLCSAEGACLLHSWCPLFLGYVDIGVIPKGARDIRVMEVEGAGNFLAIRSEDPEKYYLNGGFIIQWNGNYKLAGTVFQYDRKGDLEKLMATGPTNESVWLQVTQKGNCWRAHPLHFSQGVC